MFNKITSQLHFIFRSQVDKNLDYASPSATFKIHDIQFNFKTLKCLPSMCILFPSKWNFRWLLLCISGCGIIPLVHLTQSTWVLRLTLSLIDRQTVKTDSPSYPSAITIDVFKVSARCVRARDFCVMTFWAACAIVCWFLWLLTPRRRVHLDEFVRAQSSPESTSVSVVGISTFREHIF